MDFITAPLVVFIIFYFFYRILCLYATRRERLLFIEKMTTPPPYGEAKAPAWMPPVPLYMPQAPVFPSAGRFKPLRWGCAAMGVGLGIFLGYMSVLAFNSKMMINEPWHVVNQYGALFGALMLFFGGLGLLIAYAMEARDVHRNEKEAE